VPRPPHVDHYARLGVAPSASAEEIASAFRDRAKELHPDLWPGDARAAEGFKALTEAYDVLSRPERRAAYDRARPGPGPVIAPPAAAREPVFQTPGRALVALWSGIVLVGLGMAGAVALVARPTSGSGAEIVTLWIVVGKLLIGGGVLATAGGWRFRRLRSPALS
jgi:hypothetical protein